MNERTNETMEQTNENNIIVYGVFVRVELSSKHILYV